MSKKTTILTIVAIVLLIAATVALAASRSNNSNNSDYSNSSNCSNNSNYSNHALPSAEELMQVTLPEGTTSQMLHYTGFTVSFNADHALPNYSVWELTAAEAVDTVANRKGQKFTTDPAAKGCPANKDYTNSGFSKGHMCPAADMKWSKQAMADCFYLTNMCPQKADLNTGAWGRLEIACRKWAQRDSAIIIVCGPILTDRMPQTIGKTTQISVPQRFFKAVLAPYANPPRAIAFIFPNSNPEGGMPAVATTVDAVEQATGFDLFPALPDSIENEIEAQCNFPLWNQPQPRKR